MRPYVLDLKELAKVPLRIRRHPGAERALGIDLEIALQLRETAAHEESFADETLLAKALV